MAGPQRGLFDPKNDKNTIRSAPLAARMRPTSLDDMVGQQTIIGIGRIVRRAIEHDTLFSMILWGPPGCGKTTLARIIAEHTAAFFEPLSAVTAGVADLRRVVHEARDRLGMYQQRTVLFIDEIHRFNKAQQDAILPHVEDGTVILIGATTENPSFEVNPALRSRARIFVLESLTDEQLGEVIDRAVNDHELGLGQFKPLLAADARGYLIDMANGDARVALNALEAAVTAKDPGIGDKRLITVNDMREALQSRATKYDKNGELHYDAISALHKSVRSSDPDASLYWLGRMLEGGEDPMYVARRLVRMSIEDIGLADPQAVIIANSIKDTVHFLGQPEGDLALANLVVYLAQAPKSNSVEVAYMKAKIDVAETRNDPVPLHLRNAPTQLMKGLGYGRGYQYAHNAPDARVDQVHFPDNLRGRRYYHPTDRGYEVRIAERLAWREELESVKPLPEVEAPVRPKPSLPVDAMIDPQASAGEEPQIPIESAEAVARPSKRAKREPRG
jgi:putative ATPase